MAVINKEELFQAVIDDDAEWRELVNALWDTTCLNQDDKRRILVLATGRGSGGGGGGGEAFEDVQEEFTPLNVNTSANHVAASNHPLGFTPVDGSIPYVVWNGRIYLVGDGDRDARMFYFSSDTGATAKAHSAITATNTLWFNPLTGGEPMVSTDNLYVFYHKAP